MPLASCFSFLSLGSLTSFTTGFVFYSQLLRSGMLWIWKMVWVRNYARSSDEACFFQTSNIFMKTIVSLYGAFFCIWLLYDRSNLKSLVINTAREVAIPKLWVSSMKGESQDLGKWHIRSLAFSMVFSRCTMCAILCAECNSQLTRCAAKCCWGWEHRRRVFY